MISSPKKHFPIPQRFFFPSPCFLDRMFQLALYSIGKIGYCLLPAAANHPAARQSGPRTAAQYYSCIGDGMGSTRLPLPARPLPVPQDALDGANALYALVSTHNSAGSNDSAAAITAILCSIKTRNDRHGQDEKGVNWISLPQHLHRGLSPRSCRHLHHHPRYPRRHGAHIHNRDLEARIAEQMCNARIDVLLGGGRKYGFPTPNRKASELTAAICWPKLSRRAIRCTEIDSTASRRAVVYWAYSGRCPHHTSA